MSLIDLWSKSKNQLEGKQVQQIISIAGSGKLLDGGEASKEFRDFISSVPYSEEQEIEEPVAEGGERTRPRPVPVNFNDACTERIQAFLKQPLVRQTRTGYSTPDGSIFVFCSVSKAYSRAEKEGYWYAFHPHQKEKLETVSKGFVAFRCGSEMVVLLIPFEVFKGWLERAPEIRTVC